MAAASVMEWVVSPAALGLIGLCIGSFLNVVIFRLPVMLERRWQDECASLNGGSPPERDTYNLVVPRSRCTSCGHRIRWWENLPVLSYALLRGRCGACKTSISLRYPLVELLTAALFVGAALRLGATPVTLLWCGVLAALVALTFIDWDTTLLPDDVTLPLLWGGLIAAALGWTVPLPQALWGAVAGYLSLWAVYWLFKLLTGKEGMGYGDFKLLAALGAWLGWPLLLPIIIGASVAGTVVGIVMKLSGSLREGRYVPFGPFLATAAAFIILAHPGTVLQWFGWV